MRKESAVAGFTGWLRRPLFGVRDVAVLPVAFAILLSIAEMPSWLVMTAAARGRGWPS